MSEEFAKSDKEKPLGVLSLVAVGYFWVSGAIYALEPALTMGPTGLVFLVILLAPIIYVIPVAILMSDLTVAFPINGGWVAWVETAVGKFIGGHNTYWCWMMCLVDCAVYPLFAGYYGVEALGISKSYAIPITQLIVLLILVVRLRGIQFIVNFSSALAIFSLIPTVFLILFSLPYADPSQWVRTDGVYNCTTPISGAPPPRVCRATMEWGLLLPLILWSWVGFFDLGTLAGQVKNPRRTMPIAACLLICIVMVEVNLPLALGVSVDPVLSHHVEGYYSTIALIVAGKWLKVLFSVAAITNQLGTANGMIVVSDEALQFFLTQRFSSYLEEQAKSNSPTMRWLFSSQDKASPIVVIVNTIFLSAFVFLPFSVAIAVGMILLNISTLLLLYSYVYLKQTRPDADWIYGNSAQKAMLLCLSPALVSIVMVYYALMDSTDSYLNLKLAAGIVLLGMLFHVLAQQLGTKSFMQ